MGAMWKGFYKKWLSIVYKYGWAIKRWRTKNKGVLNKKHIEARLVEHTNSLFCLFVAFLFGLSKSLLDHFDWCTSFFWKHPIFVYNFLHRSVFIGAVQHFACLVQSNFISYTTIAIEGRSF